MMLKRGSKGDEVRQLQKRMVQLGYDIEPDGDFGAKTDAAVKELQTMFGYTVDGIVGDGTNKLIDAQIGYGWNSKSPDAKQRAMAAQGKGDMGKSDMSKGNMGKGTPGQAPPKGAPAAKAPQQNAPPGKQR